MITKPDNYGYNDWRLPTDKELESLIDRNYYNPALPEGHPFEGVINDWYLTSTPSMEHHDYLWCVLLSNGSSRPRLKKSYLETLCLWPVRTDNKPWRVLNELAGYKFYSLINGRKYRFYGDKDTIADMETGLMWTRDAGLYCGTLEGAEEFIRRRMNHEKCCRDVEVKE